MLILVICIDLYEEMAVKLENKMEPFFIRTPRPVIVEPLEQLDDEDGLPEKLAQKNPMYQK